MHDVVPLLSHLTPLRPLPDNRTDISGAHQCLSNGPDTVPDVTDGYTSVVVPAVHLLAQYILACP
jgi:hypothetical protein